MPLGPGILFALYGFRSLQYFLLGSAGAILWDASSGTAFAMHIGELSNPKNEKWTNIAISTASVHALFARFYTQVCISENTIVSPIMTGSLRIVQTSS